MAPKCCSPLLCLCKKYHNFIRDILYEMIRSGATTVLGKVAENFLYVQLCIRRYSHSVLVWQPLVERCKISSVLSGWQGGKGVNRVATKKGFVLDKKGLKWALTAYRLTFFKEYTCLIFFR